MRLLTLSRDQYETHVYPIFGSATSPNDGEFETSLRTIRKLKDPVQTEAAPMTDEERKQIRPGVAVFVFRRLVRGEETASFDFEEDEHALLLKRLVAHKPHIPAIAQEEFDALIKHVEQAPKKEES